MLCHHFAMHTTTGTHSLAPVHTDHIRPLGLRTRVLSAGPQEPEEAVLYVHGGPGSANDFDHLLPLTGAFARSVALDLPGWGEADKPKDWSYSPDAYANFLAAAARELGIGRAHLVLGDIGTVAALLWAAADPDAFASATMFGAGMLIGYRWHPVARLHRLPFVGELAAVAGRVGFNATMRLYEPRLDRGLRDQWRSEFGWPTRRAVLRFWREEQALGAGSERIVPILRALDRPALVIWGRRDRFVPVEQAERQRESFPRAEIAIFEESFHYPHLDDPDRTAELVVPFLRRQLG